MTDEARWREVVDEVMAAFGRLDILVNSAGIATLGNIETTTLADFRKVSAVNAEGVFLGCREAVRAMKETGGSIVNLSSVAGIIGDSLGEMVHPAGHARRTQGADASRGRSGDPGHP